MIFPVNISESASAAAKDKLKKRGVGNSIRLGVKGGGCNGFSYVIEFEDREPAISDVVYVDENIKWIIDSKSAVLLSGSTLNWIEKGIMYKGLEFSNPNELSKCGCGSSFNTK